MKIATAGGTERHEIWRKNPKLYLQLKTHTHTKGIALSYDYADNFATTQWVFPVYQLITKYTRYHENS